MSPLNSIEQFFPYHSGCVGQISTTQYVEVAVHYQILGILRLVLKIRHDRVGWKPFKFFNHLTDHFELPMTVLKE